MWERLLSGKFVSLYEKNGYNITLRIEKIMWGDQMGSFGVSKKNGTLKIMTIVSRAAKELNSKKLTISFPNNAALTGFVKRLNFTKDTISQYEMYLTL